MTSPEFAVISEFGEMAQQQAQPRPWGLIIRDVSLMGSMIALPANQPVRQHKIFPSGLFNPSSAPCARSAVIFWPRYVYLLHPVCHQGRLTPDRSSSYPDQVVRTRGGPYNA
jgi:hypothetical protein